MSEKESTDSQPAKGRAVTSYASKVFQESSVGIVATVAQTTSTKRKVFKFLVLIFCLTGFLYQAGEYLSFVFQYPTAVDIDVLRPDTYNVPAYTFCDNNRINRRIFCEKFPSHCEEPSEALCAKYPDYCGENRTVKPKKEFYRFHESEMKFEDIIDLNVKLDTFAEVIEGELGEIITGPYLRVKEMDPNLQVQLCYSFNDRVNNSLLPLISTQEKIARTPVNSFKFEVKADEMFLPGYRPGILFALHSPFQAVNPFETGVFMRPGRTYMVYVSMDEEVSQKSPYDTNCVNYTELWEKNGRFGPRSQEMCIHNCLSNVSLKCYDCIVPFFLYPRPERYCSTEDMSKTERCEEEFPEKACDSVCRDDCRQTRFHFQVQERFKGYYDDEGNMKQNIEDFIYVEIYLDGDEVLVYKHTPKYMNVEVFSSIGGFIGIWLGMSLLDILDILEGFFRISRFSFKKR